MVALYCFVWYGTFPVIRWDDPYGPIMLTVVLIFALTAHFVLKVL